MKKIAFDGQRFYETDRRHPDNGPFIGTGFAGAAPIVEPTSAEKAIFLQEYVAALNPTGVPRAIHSSVVKIVTSDVISHLPEGMWLKLPYYTKSPNRPQKQLAVVVGGEWLVVSEGELLGTISALADLSFSIKGKVLKKNLVPLTNGIEDKVPQELWSHL